MKICIAGFAGCGKTTVARIVSELSGLDMLNITFKDIAQEKGISFEEIQKLAEKDPSIDRELDAFLVKRSDALGNCVVSTWLCPWIIKDADIRVCLEAGLEERARRIAGREKLSYQDAFRHAKQRDVQNIERYKKLYGIDITERNVFDLVINSEKVSAEQAAKLIVAFMGIRK